MALSGPVGLTFVTGRRAAKAARHPLGWMPAIAVGQLIVGAALMALLLLSCTDEPDPVPESTTTPAVTPTGTPQAETTAAPAPTLSAPLSAAEVYARVSPSIPFIQTPAGTGSGVLIEGGYVVTNYHVVWPYETVRVVFPGGQQLQHVPVVGWDFMADLAVLGPAQLAAFARL